MYCWFLLFQGDPSLPMFLAPAVTPWKSTIAGIGSNNPSVRLYIYERSSGAILDYYQYYLNLSAANAAETDTWLMEYQMTEDFNMDDVSPKSLANLVDSFLQNDTVFNKYYRYNSVSHDLSDCSGVCKQGHMCAICAVDYGAYNVCMSVPSGDWSAFRTAQEIHEWTFVPKHEVSQSHHLVTVFAFLILISLCVSVGIKFMNRGNTNSSPTIKYKLLTWVQSNLYIVHVSCWPGCDLSVITCDAYIILWLLLRILIVIMCLLFVNSWSFFHYSFSLFNIFYIFMVLHHPFLHISSTIFSLLVWEYSVFYVPWHFLVMPFILMYRILISLPAYFSFKHPLSKFCIYHQLLVPPVFVMVILPIPIKCS